MPRKADPNSQYRVSIHLNNGYRYASTQPYEINPDTGKKSYHHITISTGEPLMKTTDSYLVKTT